MRKGRIDRRRRVIGERSRFDAGSQRGSHPRRVAGALCVIIAALLSAPPSVIAAAGKAAPAEGNSPPPVNGRASAPDPRSGDDSPASRGASPQARERARLDRAIGRLLASAPAGMVIGVAVVSGETGETLYAHGAERPLIPASNAKIFTIGAALDRLGPDFTFRTEALASSPIEGGVLEGPLILRGTGDPSLTTEDLWGLVIDLEALGIRRIAGDLLLDDAAFDRNQAPAAGDARFGDRPYGALASALTSNFNTIAVEVAPGPRVGGPARVVTVPPLPRVRVANRARTGPGTKGRDTVAVSITEPAGQGPAELVTARGTIPAGAAPRRIWRSVGRPTLVTGLLFKALLERADIAVGGTVRRGAAPPGARVLARRDSAPLAVLLRQVGKRSSNLYAEQILRALSEERPASTRGGIESVERWLAGVGIPRGAVRLVDGSGLSRNNRARAGDLARALRAGARNARTGAEFRSAFAIAGLDGTLAERLVGLRGRMRGKTGYLAGVSSLSGWTTTRAGREIFFSIVANEIGADPARAKALQDRIVLALAEEG